jgi:transcriptional regulator with XRE-family HTH domain
MQSGFIKTKGVLATNIRAFRLSAGLSQEDLALLAGIDRTYASQIEREVSNPSLKVLCSLAEVLKVNLEDLLKPQN